MAERPILFNTKMVKAIIDGRKTQTRRLLRNIRAYSIKTDLPTNEPPCKPGDILWVRETWDSAPSSNSGPCQFVNYYKADGDLRPVGWRGNWHPSIHMPKEAARIFLRVKDVRVERLQEITDRDAEREGVSCFYPGTNMVVPETMNFIKVWDNTIKPAYRDKYGWNANPWVWVITFERCDKPKGWC